MELDPRIHLHRRLSMAQKKNRIIYDSRQVGQQLRPGHFAWLAGRGLGSIVDPLGRTYLPNRYDIPQWRYRILRFCIEFIIAMMFSGNICRKSPGQFGVPLLEEPDAWKLHDLLRKIANNLSFFDSVRESGVEWDPNMRLLDPTTIRQFGRQHDTAPLLKEQFRGPRYFDTRSIKLPPENSLVVIATVRSMAESGDVGAVGTRWPIAFDVTNGAGQEILRNELARGYYEDVQIFELPTAVVRDPSSLASNQQPQFLTAIV